MERPENWTGRQKRQQDFPEKEARSEARKSVEILGRERVQLLVRMANKGQQPPKQGAAATRPTITLPPRSSVTEALLGDGGGGRGPGSSPIPGLGFSPGPMTLVSSFFSEGEECKSFSQLLAGAMGSPSTLASSSGDLRYRQNRPEGLVAATPPGMFSIPPGLSPTNLLDSPGFLTHLPVSVRMFITGREILCSFSDESYS